MSLKYKTIFDSIKNFKMLAFEWYKIFHSKTRNDRDILKWKKSFYGWQHFFGWVYINEIKNRTKITFKLITVLSVSRWCDALCSLVWIPRVKQEKALSNVSSAFSAKKILFTNINKTSLIFQDFSKVVIWKHLFWEVL